MNKHKETCYGTRVTKEGFPEDFASTPEDAGSCWKA